MVELTICAQLVVGWFQNVATPHRIASGRSHLSHEPAPQIPGSVRKDRGFAFHQMHVESTLSQPGGEARRSGRGAILPVPDRGILPGPVEGSLDQLAMAPGYGRGSVAPRHEQN